MPYIPYLYNPTKPLYPSTPLPPPTCTAYHVRTPRTSAYSCTVPGMHTAPPFLPFRPTHTAPHTTKQRQHTSTPALPTSRIATGTARGICKVPPPPCLCFSLFYFSSEGGRAFCCAMTDIRCVWAGAGPGEQEAGQGGDVCMSCHAMPYMQGRRMYAWHGMACTQGKYVYVCAWLVTSTGVVSCV